MDGPSCGLSLCMPASCTHTVCVAPTALAAVQEAEHWEGQSSLVYHLDLLSCLSLESLTLLHNLHVWCACSLAACCAGADALPSAGWAAGVSPCSAPGWHPGDPLHANHTTARPDPAGGCTACRCSWRMARCCWRCGLPGCCYPAHQLRWLASYSCYTSVLPVLPTLSMHSTCHPRRCATCWARCSSVWRGTRATAACSTRWRIPSLRRHRDGWRVRSAPSAWTPWR